MLRVRRVLKPAPQPDVPVLRSLGPEYEEKLHGRHAAALLTVLADKSENTPRNIALAGHYGSGKSSVLLGVQAGLDKQKINWVNLSLSSLGIDNTKRERIDEDGAPAPLTNLIQKEIVKQLLYRRAPADMPESRYFRIDSFKPLPAVLWSVAVAMGFFVVAVLFGLVSRVEKVGPRDLVTINDWVPWAIVGGLSVLLGGVWFLGLRALQSRVRVQSVSAGGAAVTLSARENSYFDEYLDEIFYFFQKTKTKIAIFEDLDRFKDPHIFETLRELNTILNNSEQLKARPVRFVYAVRDSIFEQLQVGLPKGSANTESDAVVPLASALETAPSANRTKFFDLVVPMVPFITHRSARDLLEAEFDQSAKRPSPELVNLVGTHLTDMRLIRNIRNEFEIYQPLVLGEKGLKGLGADQLFAMMVYKNLHLEDFEAVRLGTSGIDKAYKAFRAMVEYQTDHQTRLSKDAMDQIASSDDLWDQHAKAAGERLQKILPILNRAMPIRGRPVLQFRSESFHMSDLPTGAFWRSLYETREAVQLLRRAGGGVPLSFDELIMLVGDEAMALDNAVEVDVTKLERASRVALETKDFVARATMEELMARTDLTMPIDRVSERNLNDIVASIVSPLAVDLLAEGYIDENFTLYCSDFHGIALSVQTMNFILHCVQSDHADHRFQFDEASSIDAVEKEEGDRFIDGESIFNIGVFDHYLNTNPERLNKAIDKLLVRVETDSTFLDAYLVDGASGEALVNQMAPRWTGVFIHLIERAPLDLAVTITLADAAVQSARGDVDYESSHQVARFVSEHYAQMQAFTEPMAASQAADVAVLLRRLRAKVSDLEALGEAQRKAVVAAGLYPITRANLSMALGEGTGLALDRVKAADEAVYGHILENMGAYLDALQEDEVTIYDPEEFVAVLSDVAEVAELAVLPVAKGASESCEVANLGELDETDWNAVVSVGRFSPTVRNVSLFVEKFGVSEELTINLGSVDLAEAEEVEEESRFELGYALTGADDLGPAVRVRLVEQLELPGGLDPERLTDAGIRLIPALLAAGLVPDAAETYARVGGLPFILRERYFAAAKDLASYVCDLPLSRDDLPMVMRSQRVAAGVKRTITDDVEFLRARLSRSGAIAVCEWATRGSGVSVEVLVELSEAEAPAEHILSLLKPHLPDIELAVLDRVLLALGDEYEALTWAGRRPKLKDRDGTEELLKTLQRHGRVSSFSPAWGGGIRVNMRR